MYRSTLWGGLQVSELPRAILEGSLDTDAITALAVLLDAEKTTTSIERKIIRRKSGYFPGLEDGVGGVAKIPIQKKRNRPSIIERTGLSINVVKAAIRKLKESGWLGSEAQHRRNGKFCAGYTLTKPNPSPLEWMMGPIPLGRAKGKNLLWASAVPYFTFPRCIIRESHQRWSIAQMSSAEIRLYFELCCQANKARGTEFKSKLLELAKLTGMDVRTVHKRTGGLESRGLVVVERLEGLTVTEAKKTDITVKMCDPYTGQSLHKPYEDVEAEESNYLAKFGRASRRANFNLSAEEVEKFIRELADGPIITQGSGDLTIRCPFHADNNPSLSVSPLKRCWQCFGCRETGNLYDLIMGLTGCGKQEALQRIGRAAGQDVRFERPDSEAIIYRYKDKYGNTLKEVLRFPGKVIRQRQPVTGGHRWDVQGLKPMLYHRELMDVYEIDGRAHFPDTVVICEGEKDADAVTGKLWFRDSRDKATPVICVTSGGADSWHASLAKELRTKRVIIMPDDDEAGKRYAANIKASLDAEGIEYREVSFAGTGAKDVSDYLELHTVNELAKLIGGHWVGLESGVLAVEGTPLPPFSDGITEKIGL